MRLPRFEYLRPVSLEECLAAFQGSGKETRLLAGGTDLLVNMKFRVTCPERIVSLRSIPELRGVSENGKGGLRIGACVTLSELARDPLVSEKIPALHQAVRSVASWHIRNMATLGGNLCLPNRCWYYNQSKLWRDALGPCIRRGGSPCHAIKGAKRCHAINNSDTAPVLMALEAHVCVRRKDGERIIPIKDFYRDDGDRHTILEPDEVLTSVIIPGSSLSQPASFIKVCDRQGLDFATGSVAAMVKGNGKGAPEIRLVINSIASTPLFLQKASQTILESGLKQGAISEAATIARTELGTITNLFTSAGYKRQIAEVLVKRALNNLKEQTRGKGRTKN